MENASLAPPPGHHKTYSTEAELATIREKQVCKGKKEKPASGSSSSSSPHFCSAPECQPFQAFAGAWLRLWRLGSANYSPGAESNPQHVFVNEIYWNTASPLFMYQLWLLPNQVAEFSSLNRLDSLQKLKYLLSGSLQEKFANKGKKKTEENQR